MAISELLPRTTAPNTIAEWKAVAEGLLSDECCAFHRNIEISARYASLYKAEPATFKWAAMAAIASHHVRLVLFPLPAGHRWVRLRGHPAQSGPSPQRKLDITSRHEIGMVPTVV